MMHYQAILPEHHHAHQQQQQTMEFLDISSPSDNRIGSLRKIWRRQWWPITFVILSLFGILIGKRLFLSDPLDSTTTVMDDVVSQSKDSSLEVRFGQWDDWKQYMTLEAAGQMESNVQDTWNATDKTTEDEANKTKVWWTDETNKTSLWWEKEVNATREWFHSTTNITHAWWYDKTHSDSSNDEETLVYMNNSAAYSLLINGYGWSENSKDYFLLQQGWDAQINQAYCPVATSAAILNSLRGEFTLPMDSSYDPYPYATQHDLFNNCTNAHVIHRNETFDGIFAAPGGLGMDQTMQLLKCHLSNNDSWTVKAHHLDPSLVTMNQMRQDMVLALRNPMARVMINFDRASVQQIGHGHWSPIGSYSWSKDAFLVMDVAKYKYPAVWIPTAMLYQSLTTVDVCGSWNFPHAQQHLPQNLLYPKTMEDYAKAMIRLGCQATYRGYIIVEKL